MGRGMDDYFKNKYGKPGNTNFNGVDYSQMDRYSLIEILRQTKMKEDKQQLEISDKNRAIRGIIGRAKRAKRRLFIAGAALGITAGVFAGIGVAGMFPTEPENLGGVVPSAYDNVASDFAQPRVMEKDGKYSIIFIVDENNPEVLIGHYKDKPVDYYMDTSAARKHNENPKFGEIYLVDNETQNHVHVNHEKKFVIDETLKYDGNNANTYIVNNLKPGIYHLYTPEGKEIGTLKLPEIVKTQTQPGGR